MILALHFAKPIHTAHGVHDNVNTKRNVDRILPARLEANGEPLPCDKGQAVMGFIIERAARGIVGQKAAVHRDFVPWANVTQVAYETPEK